MGRIGPSTDITDRIKVPYGSEAGLLNELKDTVKPR